jgi:hypothetical protein
MTSNYILAKIDNVKQKMCQKLIDGEESIDTLKQVEKALIQKDEPDNYYQAEAIRQSIAWYEELNNQI